MTYVFINYCIITNKVANNLAFDEQKFGRAQI